MKKLIIGLIIILISIFGVLIYYKNSPKYINCSINSYHNGTKTTFNRSYYIDSRHKIVRNYKYKNLKSEWYNNYIVIYDLVKVLTLDKYSLSIKGQHNVFKDTSYEGSCKQYYFHKF